MTDQPAAVSLHAWVDGQVQGVGFRYFTLQRAEAHELNGWVRNLFDGRVEVMAEGPRSNLEDFLEDLRRGPRSGYVNEVRIEWNEASGQFRKFSIAPSY